MGEEQTIKAAGHVLEAVFEPAARSDAPVLVLLHEGLGSAALWGKFPAELARASGAGVLAYSREGYGASSPVPLPRPLDYMRRHASEVLPQLIAQIEGRRIFIIGHSDGATIAALYAAGEPDPRVAGVALIAPHFFVEEFAIAEIARTKEAYETTDLRAKLARWHSHVDVAFRGWNESWLHPDFGRTLEMRRDLQNIGMPVLGMQGADDQYGTLAQIDALEEALRGSGAPFTRCILPGVRHSPHREAQDETIAALCRFIDHTGDEGKPS